MSDYLELEISPKNDDLVIHATSALDSAIAESVQFAAHAVGLSVFVKAICERIDEKTD